MIKNKKAQGGLIVDWAAFLFYIFWLIILTIVVVNPGCVGSGQVQQKIDEQMEHAEETDVDFSALSFLKQNIAVDGETKSVSDFIVDYYYQKNDDVLKGIETAADMFFEMKEDSYCWVIDVREGNKKFISIDNKRCGGFMTTWMDVLSSETTIPTPSERNLLFVVKKREASTQEAPI